MLQETNTLSEMDVEFPVTRQVLASALSETFAIGMIAIEVIDSENPRTERAVGLWHAGKVLATLHVTHLTGGTGRAWDPRSGKPLPPQGECSVWADWDPFRFAQTAYGPAQPTEEEARLLEWMAPLVIAEAEVVR